MFKPLKAIIKKELLDAIRDGKVLATADQHGDQLAVYGIETALKLIADKSATVEDVETPVDLITAKTLP